MYLETMEQVLGGMDKVIIDNKGAANGVVPYLPLELGSARTDRAVAGGRRPMKRGIFGGVGLVVIVVIAVALYLSVFIVDQTQQALVLRFGQVGARDPRRPGSITSCRWSTTSSISTSASSTSTRRRSRSSPRTRSAWWSTRSAATRSSIRSSSSSRSATSEVADSRLSILLNSAVRRVLGDASFIQLVRDDRADLMTKITTAGRAGKR